MYPTSVLLRKGHRTRVALAGADASLFERYPTEVIIVVQSERFVGCKFDESLLLAGSGHRDASRPRIQTSSKRLIIGFWRASDLIA
jgi:hypothetical protein